MYKKRNCCLALFMGHHTIPFNNIVSATVHCYEKVKGEYIKRLTLEMVNNKDHFKAESLFCNQNFLKYYCYEI